VLFILQFSVDSYSDVYIGEHSTGMSTCVWYWSTVWNDGTRQKVSYNSVPHNFQGLKAFKWVSVT